MDTKTLNFLSEHNLDCLSEVFKENHITYEVLCMLREKDIDEFIKPVGLKVLLRSALKKLQGNRDEAAESSHFLSVLAKTENTELPNNDGMHYIMENSPPIKNEMYPEVCSSMQHQMIECEPDCPDDSDDSRPKKIQRLTNFFNCNKSVLQLMESTCKGQVILRAYQKNGSLDSQDRRILVQILIDALLERHVTVKSMMFKDLAVDIVATFPNENVDTYFAFNPAISKNPRGKLMDKYKSERGYRKKYSSPVDDEPEQEQEQEIPNINLQTVVEDNDDVKWLQCNHEPWSEVQRLWMKTLFIRKLDFASHLPLPRVFDKWPLLRHPAGYTLVCS